VLRDPALFVVAPVPARLSGIVDVLRELNVGARGLFVEFPNFSDAGFHLEALEVGLFVEDVVGVCQVRPDVARAGDAGSVGWS
jgi:hypothetical protein